GVGPKADGTLTEEAVVRMKEIGAWLKQNGAAIYDTRTVEHFQEGALFFTRSKTGNQQYAIYCADKEIPATIKWSVNLPAKGSTLRCLTTGQKVKWSLKDNQVHIQVPASLRQRTDLPAIAFSFTPA